MHFEILDPSFIISEFFMIRSTVPKVIYLYAFCVFFGCLVDVSGYRCLIDVRQCERGKWLVLRTGYVCEYTMLLVSDTLIRIYIVPQSSPEPKHDTYRTGVAYSCTKASRLYRKLLTRLKYSLLLECFIRGFVILYSNRDPIGLETLT